MTHARGLSPTARWVCVALGTAVLGACQGGARGRAGDTGAGMDGSVAGATAPAAPAPKKTTLKGRNPLSRHGPEPEETLPDATLDPSGELGLYGLPPTGTVVTGPTHPDDPERRAPCKVEDDPAADLAEKFETAQSAMRADRDELALDIVNAVIAQEPKEPWGTRFRGLRQEIRSRHLETDVVRVDVRGVVEYVPFETDIDLILRIRNVGTSDLVIEPPSGEGLDAISGAIFALTIRRRDRDVYAAELTQSWTQNVPLFGPGQCVLRIPPEGQHEVRVRVRAEDAGPPLAGLRVLEVGGDLRAGRIVTGISEPFGRIPIRTGRVVVLPRNFEPLAADPLGSIRKALAARAPVHLLIATEFLAPADRAAAVEVFAKGLSIDSADLRATLLNCLHLLRRAAVGTALRPLAEPLVVALRANPDRARDLMEGLRALTGVSLAADARLWEDWWRRELLGAPSVVPGDEDLGGSGTGSSTR